MFATRDVIQVYNFFVIGLANIIALIVVYICSLHMYKSKSKILKTYRHVEIAYSLAHQFVATEQHILYFDMVTNILIIH